MTELHDNPGKGSGAQGSERQVKHRFLMVDDEELVRTGFREKIDWHGLGFEFLEPCANGLQALEAVAKFRPDVVMTDICMPQMDGLELSRTLSQRYPDVRVVVLSGHDDFEYARESLRNRVIDYILKPLTSEALKAFLLRLGRELERPRPLSEHEAIQRLAEGTLDEDQPLPLQAPAGRDSPWCVGRLALFPPQGWTSAQVLERTERVLGDRPRPWTGLACAAVKYGGQVVHVDVAFTGADADHAGLRASRDAGLLLLAFREAGFLGCGALAEPRPSAEGLGAAWAEAADATLVRLFRTTSADGLFLSRNGAGGGPLTALSERFATLVREGDRPGSAAFLDDLRQTLPQERCSPTTRRDLLNLLGDDSERVLETCADAAALVAAVGRTLERALDEVSVRGASLADRALARFRDEIAARLSEADLSVEEVSRCLQLSPSYLAKLLRRKWETSFSRYLREARLARAKELLAATNWTTTRISEQTGFSDYRYFSNQFKRFVGVTPSAYRSQSRKAS
jgi:two-component system response regulator YesN